MSSDQQPPRRQRPLFDTTPTWRDFYDAYRWVFWLAGLGVGLALIVYFATFGIRWIVVPAQTMDPANVQRLSREANNSYQALQSKLATIKIYEDDLSQMVTAYGPVRSVWPQGKSSEYLQLARQITNLRTSYNEDCGQYRALWQDEWRNLPAPDDLPRTCDFLN